MMGPRPAHTTNVPSVQQLSLRGRHKQVTLLGLTIQKSRLAVFLDQSTCRQPGSVATTRAKAVAAGDTIAAGHRDNLSRRDWRIGDDAVPRIDPDQASDVA